MRDIEVHLATVLPVAGPMRGIVEAHYPDRSSAYRLNRTDLERLILKADCEKKCEKGVEIQCSINERLEFFEYCTNKKF